MSFISINPQITGGAQLAIVDNSKVICASCLLSAPDLTSTDYIVCTIDDSRKRSNSFCKEGLWMCNGKTMGFSEALEHVYSQEVHPKDIG